jgi:PTS system ascorbate-specific IIA component
VSDPAHRLSTRVAARHDVEAVDWQDAVRAAVAPLISLGAAEQRYVDACVASVEQHGPYIVLAPGLALAHARPEDGGLAVGVAVTRLARPVEFGHADNDPVDLVIAFASPDADAHVAALSTLARALGAGLADRLRDAADTTALESTLASTLQP